MRDERWEACVIYCTYFEFQNVPRQQEEGDKLHYVEDAVMINEQGSAQLR